MPPMAIDKAIIHKIQGSMIAVSSEKFAAGWQDAGGLLLFVTFFKPFNGVPQFGSIVHRRTDCVIGAVYFFI